MCGRYASSHQPDELVDEYEIEHFDVRETLEPDYNVAPTKDVYAVVSRPPREDKSAPATRRLRVVQWGLVPSWAKDPSIGNRMINARVETVADKPAFKRAFAVRRCLLPADGYYEWYQTQRIGPRGKPVKQPFFIRPADGSTLSMAGLYEIWRDPSMDPSDDAAWRWTSTVLTTTATDELGQIHDRMPLLVEPDRYADWLDPASPDPKGLLELLVPALPGGAGARLEAFAVSTEVNNVANNGPQLVDPVAAEPPGPA
ncbi:MAG: SOS response-associated peptidase [Nocardioidaceae bacterium]